MRLFLTYSLGNCSSIHLSYEVILFNLNSIVFEPRHFLQSLYCHLLCFTSFYRDLWGKTGGNPLFAINRSNLNSKPVYQSLDLHSTKSFTNTPAWGCG